VASLGLRAGGRRDPPGLSREADATAVTLGEFRQAVAGVCCAPNA
jgi:hypothetical protein